MAQKHAHDPGVSDSFSTTSEGSVQTAPGSGERVQYANKVELILSLVGYAVGLGNVWRFPYLAYTYGGGAFLIPYLVALVLLGLPLFVLELGLGQLTRRGTLGVWQQLGLPRWQGVGVAATLCTFFVSLYYNVILAWTIYYLGRTFMAMPSGILPWSDTAPGFSCPETIVYPSSAIADDPFLFDPLTGFVNESVPSTSFWCPAEAGAIPPEGFLARSVKPLSCPGRAAAVFWEAQALQQSSGMDDPGGFSTGMLISFTIAWALIYLVVFKGIASSGKVVYVTATLPYLCLVIFFVRAVTLPGALTGLKFFVTADFGHLADPQVWLRAAVQIFYSLGVGYGSLIAFASYGSKKNNFVRDAMSVSLINCGTSIFAGFVVFPILGFLAWELKETDPCMTGTNLDELKSIGLQGTGLAFIAFPIAIDRMAGSFFFAVLFFLMLLALGIDSQFAMVETVVTVLSDAGLHKKLSRPALSGLVCLVSYLLGLIFVCRGGIYWFNLFDYYSSLLVMFAVTCLECVGLTWPGGGQKWAEFRERCKEWTGRELGLCFHVGWTWVCPFLLCVLLLVNVVPPIGKLDLMDAGSSKPYPEGTGYLPTWSIYIGWCIALVPILSMALVAAFPQMLRHLKEHGDEAAIEASG